MRATSRRIRKEVRRDQLLDVAAELIAERGFASMRLEDLGSAVGISGPAIYRYFPSKESVLAELLTGVSTRLLESASACVSHAESPRRALIDLIDQHIDFAIGNPDLIRVQDRDLFSLPESTRRVVRRRQRRYATVWSSTVRDVHPDLDAAAATTLVHILFGLLNCTPHVPPGQSRAELRPALRRAAHAVAHLSPCDESVLS